MTPYYLAKLRAHRRAHAHPDEDDAREEEEREEGVRVLLGGEEGHDRDLQAALEQLEDLHVPCVSVRSSPFLCHTPLENIRQTHPHSIAHDKNALRRSNDHTIDHS